MDASWILGRPYTALVPPACADTPPAMALAKFVSGLERMRADSSDPLVSWRQGLSLAFADLGPLGEAVARATTLGAALRRPPRMAAPENAIAFPVRMLDRRTPAPEGTSFAEPLAECRRACGHAMLTRTALPLATRQVRARLGQHQVQPRPPLRPHPIGQVGLFQHLPEPRTRRRRIAQPRVVAQAHRQQRPASQSSALATWIAVVTGRS